MRCARNSQTDAMRRKALTMLFAIACILALTPVAAEAAPAPVRIVRVSDLTPYPGEVLNVWFKSWPPNHRMKVYIDTSKNAVGSVTSSPTGYGHLRFAVSKYAMVGSRHAIGIYDTATGEAGWQIVRIVPRP